MAKKASLTEGPVVLTLAKLTLPMIFGVFSIIAFNLIDTYFVGQFGKNELAALSFTFPVVYVVGSIALGLGMGISAIVSKAVGEGNHSIIQKFTTNGLLLALFAVAIFVVFGLFTIEPLFKLLGADEITLPLISDYMEIWYLGIIFLVVPMVGNSAIRATGDTKTPGIIMTVAAVFNCVLDPVLIFGLGPIPSMGIKGAALATVFARAITLVAALYVLKVREDLITFKGLTVKNLLGSWTKILYIGLPAAGSRILMPIGVGVITRLVSEYGSEAVAGFGVGTRVDAFAFIIIIALSTALAPFVGQNLGAKKFNRVVYAIKKCNQFAFLWGVISFIILALFSEYIAKLFNSDPDIIKVTKDYLCIIPLSFCFLGVFQLNSVTLNILNKPFISALLIIFQMFILNIPIAIIGSKFFGIKGIFYALLISAFLSSIPAYYLVLKYVNKRLVVVLKS